MRNNFKTRGQTTKHCGEFEIYAEKRVDHEACELEPIKPILAKYGYTVDSLTTGCSGFVPFVRVLQSRIYA
ncbi:hypothetical protein NLX78_14535 [Paenibacillus sp. Lou8.1]|uniref:hypothetical protein n=1 Tax=Paenibacillus sp. Lou8.1 TaxID=2962041 RepID=UPI0020B71389|nr:hypothetical protein [Paenibacillus sp. Lou8.1]MCP3808453.1 hypothetical protein [Paenibacillus sp. Lou8.1]